MCDVRLIRMSPVPEIRQALKLLVVADEEPPAGAAELVSANRPDAVVTLGDLPADWLLGLSGTGVPLMGVHGNHDGEGDLEAAGIDDLHLKRTEFRGWSFTGFEGSPRSGRALRVRPGGGARAARRLAERRRAGLATPRPRAVNDDPADPRAFRFAGLREWVDEHRPLRILHGHTTPDPRTRTGRVGDTQVIWVRGARVVLLED